jgi:hypothetical protein
LASQNAVIISKIARIDFPREWPDLLDALLPIVEKSFQVDQETSEIYSLRFNALYTLHLTMKVLTSKTLPAARKFTQSITPNIFQFISTLFGKQLQLFLGLYNQPSIADQPGLHRILETLQVCRICLKCLRRLTVNGYENFSMALEATVFIVNVGST